MRPRHRRLRTARVYTSGRRGYVRRVETLAFLAYFGAAALVAGLLIGAFAVRKRRRLALTVGAGLVGGLIAWAIADARGLLEMKGSEDLGPLVTIALIGGNVFGWTLGVLVGSIWGLRHRGSVAGEIVGDR